MLTGVETRSEILVCQRKNKLANKGKIIVINSTNYQETGVFWESVLKKIRKNKKEGP